ncbi:MAG: hypothetical protein MI922_25090 [Bacteroidales bacterium]|nr:hypothetical protein [Bacteroidales bacterium]
MRIKITIDDKVFEADLYETPTGKAIYDALPFESDSHTWGDEIYFGAPVHTALEPDARAQVEVGDLGYWPSMPAFCLFFGPTPVSTSNAPQAASEVNVFGKLVKVDLELLRSVGDGQNVIISKA